MEDNKNSYSILFIFVFPIFLIIVILSACSLFYLKAKNKIVEKPVYLEKIVKKPIIVEK
ncbi:hypothetical protein [Candidatus Phytoplasma phoenicium]|uniref:Uncharacterized protein n=1 Tax=Candidatus Phytoplasma phoenicium TaxID=198422 RepID=A0A0L0MJB1_9MOLU|nr:hypothetical protein [Candidatus Phytoplasma phoenicium]KND62737.1 hypothetical protein AlmWB_00830 [Candidatus Phytoplasma phoenicium]